MCKPPVVQAALSAPPEQWEQDPVQQVQKDPVQQEHDPVQQMQDPIQHAQDPVQPAQISVQPGQPQLNWSYFKPEFSAKPEEDGEAQLVRTNDWMVTHNFPEVANIQKFFLTFIGEARLWYESLRPIVVDWKGLQEQFRQQYLKFCNTQE